MKEDRFVAIVLASVLSMSGCAPRIGQRAIDDCTVSSGLYGPNFEKIGEIAYRRVRSGKVLVKGPEREAVFRGGRERTDLYFKTDDGHVIFMDGYNNPNPCRTR